MKVALWGSYCLTEYPKGFKIPEEFDEYKHRVHLAEFLEKEVEVVSLDDLGGNNSIEKLAARVKQSKHNCVGVKGYYREDTVWFTGDGLGYWYVKDVDTSKLWLLGEYDNTESIRYYKVDMNNQLSVEEE